MSWYSFSIIYRTTIDGVVLEDPLMEESVRLLEADSVEEACSKRDAIAKAGEHSYKNEAGENVRWEVSEIGEVQDLGLSDLSEGDEVYSRLFRLSERTDAG